MSKKPDIFIPRILWPNGFFFKSFFSAYSLIAALLLFESISGRYPFDRFFKFSLGFLFLYLIFLKPLRLEIRNGVITGPDLGRFYRRCSIPLKHAEFVIAERTWGFPAFRITDKKTGNEIGSYYLYFAHKSIRELKAFAESSQQGG